MRNESQREREMAPGLIPMLTDDCHLLRGSDVPAGFPGWITVESKVVPKAALVSS